MKILCLNNDCGLWMRPQDIVWLKHPFVCSSCNKPINIVHNYEEEDVKEQEKRK